MAEEEQYTVYNFPIILTVTPTGRRGGGGCRAAEQV